MRFDIIVVLVGLIYICIKERERGKGLNLFILLHHSVISVSAYFFGYIPF